MFRLLKDLALDMTSLKILSLRYPTKKQNYIERDVSACCTLCIHPSNYRGKSSKISVEYQIVA